MSDKPLTVSSRPTAKHRGPTASAGLISAFLDVATANGARVEALAALAELDLDMLADKDARIPVDAYVRLMRTAKRLTGQPALALIFGESVDLADFSVLGAVGSKSDTIEGGLGQLNRYANLAVEADPPDGERFRIERRGSDAWLVDRRPEPNRFPELTESTFARIAASSRRAGMAFVKEVHVTHPRPGHAADYARIFGVPVTFEAASNALRLDPTVLTSPLPGKSAYSQALVTEHAERLLDRLQRAKSMRGRLEAILVTILAAGRASVEEAATRLEISRQTLYRRLKAEGCTFEQVLAELRRRLAIEYLNRRELSTTRVAELLAFSDRASFAKAFKRWTGETPASFQNKARPRSLASG